MIHLGRAVVHGRPEADQPPRSHEGSVTRECEVRQRRVGLHEMAAHAGGLEDADQIRMLTARDFRRAGHAVLPVLDRDGVARHQFEMARRSDHHVCKAAIFGIGAPSARPGGADEGVADLRSAALGWNSINTLEARRRYGIGSGGNRQGRFGFRAELRRGGAVHVLR
jgi:hypothetical protein